MKRLLQPDRNRLLSPLRQVWRWLCILCASGIAWPTVAHAYLDPGTGSMVFQVIVGVVAGAAVIVKMQWARIHRFFGGKPLETWGREQDDVDR